jgi:hypothetical protein
LGLSFAIIAAWMTALDAWTVGVPFTACIKQQSWDLGTEG